MIIVSSIEVTDSTEIRIQVVGGDKFSTEQALKDCTLVFRITVLCFSTYT